MELIRLTRKQIEEIYYERMVHDFPSDELKPLAIIFQSLNQGVYDCFGLFDKKIIGYVYVKRLNNDYLIDYLATFPTCRNKGYGGQMISLLRDCLRDANSVLGEVENPDFSDNEEERIIQTRRYNFYIRNGFVDTKVNVLCFGVQYRLIELNRVHEQEEVKELYCMHYKSMLTKDMYEKNIVI